jgi:hypothetical protein
MSPLRHAAAAPVEADFGSVHVCLEDLGCETLSCEVCYGIFLLGNRVVLLDCGRHLAYAAEEEDSLVGAAGLGWVVMVSIEDHAAVEGELAFWEDLLPGLERRHGIEAEFRSEASNRIA